MKYQIHLTLTKDASGRPTIEAMPVDDDQGTEVATAIRDILVKQLGGTQVKTVPGLEQTYIDFLIKGIEVQVCLEPYAGISITVPDATLHKDLKTKIEGTFDVVPFPEDDGE